jgi:adenine phosphoribosyltransferase
LAAVDVRRRLLERFRWTDGHADFADVFADGALLASLGPALAAPFADAGLDAVIAIEARGFVLGGMVARELGVGLVLARKPGSVHPDADVEVAATPDWRGRRVELQVSRRTRSGRLLLVDDWIETGSQARTVAALLGRRGATLAGVSVLVDGTTAAVRADLGVVARAELGPDH